MSVVGSQKAIATEALLTFILLFLRICIKFYWFPELRNQSYIENVQYELQSPDKVLLQWRQSVHKNKCIYDFVVSYFTTRGLEMQVTPDSRFLITDVDICSQFRVSITPRNQLKEFLGQSAEIWISTKVLGM